MNRFDDPEGRFLVPVDDQEQQSLWRSRREVPAGWRVVHGEDGRQACLDYVEHHWGRPLRARSASARCV